MNKKISLLIIAIAVIIVVTFLTSKIGGNHYEKSLDGKEAMVVWSELNVRHSPSGRVINTLKKGEVVTMTGHTYEYVGGDGGTTSNWVEIQLKDDSTAWVVRDGIT